MIDGRLLYIHKIYAFETENKCLALLLYIIFKKNNTLHSHLVGSGCDIILVGFYNATYIHVCAKARTVVVLYRLLPLSRRPPSNTLSLF